MLPRIPETGGWLAQFVRENELIAIRVSEDRHRSPDLGLRIGDKFDAFTLQNLGRRRHVVAPERERLKGSDAILLAFWSEQRKLGFGPRNEKLDPALTTKGLVGQNFES